MIPTHFVFFLRKRANPYLYITSISEVAITISNPTQHLLDTQSIFNFKEEKSLLTWSFSGLSEMSFRLEEVRFLWVMAGLPGKNTNELRLETSFQGHQLWMSICKHWEMVMRMVTRLLTTFNPVVFPWVQAGVQIQLSGKYAKSQILRLIAWLYFKLS